ncbi:hypothetical protein Tco_0351846 [Tanacetum coccineum]
MQVESDTSKTPLTAKGKILKTSAKADKPAKKKQPAKTSKAKGLTVLSEVALTEAEQLKLETQRSLIQTHISHASDSSADEGTGSILEVPDVPTYDSDDKQISWKSSEEDNEDEVNDDDNNDDDDNDDDVDKDINDDNADNQDDDDDEQTDSDNDGDDFVHPKLSTHDDEARKDDEVNEEESNEESDDESNEESDEEVQGANTKDEEMDEEATSLVDVSVTTIAELPLVSAITLPPPHIPLIIHMQQTPVPTPITISSSSLQNLPNFCKLTNLNVEDRLAFGVSLRMFTRSIIIKRCVEDLQLRVESYQKKLNITKPDTYRSDLKRRDAYTTYSNPKGFIYQNKDKKNKLMRIDELHKFSDEHPSDFIHNEDGNPAGANIKQTHGRSILTDSKENIKMDIEVPDSS